MPSDDEGRLGREGEAIVREWLTSQGYAILAASMIEGMGAPVLLGRERLILPDNLAWYRGEPRWIEVKTKSFASFHETPPKRLEHGIPLHHWVAYEMIQVRTHTPVSLAILQVDVHSLGISTIDGLRCGMRIYPMKGEWHIFFARDDFEWHDLSDLEMPTPIEPAAVRTIKQQRLLERH